MHYIIPWCCRVYFNELFRWQNILVNIIWEMMFTCWLNLVFYGYTYIITIYLKEKMSNILPVLSTYVVIWKPPLWRHILSGIHTEFFIWFCMENWWNQCRLDNIARESNVRKHHQISKGIIWNYSIIRNGYRSTA